MALSHVQKPQSLLPCMSRLSPLLPSTKFQGDERTFSLLQFDSSFGFLFRLFKTGNITCFALFRFVKTARKIIVPKRPFDASSTSSSTPIALHEHYDLDSMQIYSRRPQIRWSRRHKQQWCNRIAHCSACRPRSATTSGRSLWCRRTSLSSGSSILGVLLHRL